MTTRHEHQTFEGLVDRGGSAYEDIELRRCTFRSCAFGITYDPNQRSVARRIRLTACGTEGLVIRTGVFEDVTIDGLRTRGLLQVWAGAYRHVTLRGRIGRIMLSRLVEPSQATVAQQAAFDRANRDFYQQTDWAIDITEAEFEEFEPGGVPGDLIRRDPRDTALVLRERAQAGAWRSLDLSDTPWDIALSDIATGMLPSEVLVAPRRHRKYRRLVEGLDLLKEHGIAHPD